jgi:hypothetical protein
VVAALVIAVAGTDQAQARAKSKREARPRAIHGPNYHPPYADIVIDDKSGLVLHEVSADEPCHPQCSRPASQRPHVYSLVLLTRHFSRNARTN